MPNHFQNMYADKTSAASTQAKEWIMVAQVAIADSAECDRDTPNWGEIADGLDWAIDCLKNALSHAESARTYARKRAPF